MWHTGTTCMNMAGTSTPRPSRQVDDCCGCLNTRRGGLLLRRLPAGPGSIQISSRSAVLPPSQAKPGSTPQSITGNREQVLVQGRRQCLVDPASSELHRISTSLHTCTRPHAFTLHCLHWAACLGLGAPGCRGCQWVRGDRGRGRGQGEARTRLDGWHICQARWLGAPKDLSSRSCLAGPGRERPCANVHLSAAEATWRTPVPGSTRALDAFLEHPLSPTHLSLNRCSSATGPQVQRSTGPSGWSCMPVRPR